MNPGRLDRIITLLAPQATRQADGESVPLYVPYAVNLPAEQITPGTRALTQAGAAETVQRNLFRIRYRTDVRAGHRLEFEGRIFAVTGWNEDPRAPRRAALLLSVEEVSPSPSHVTAP